MNKTLESLVAVHTHTHTHTSSLLVNKKIINIYKKDSNEPIIRFYCCLFCV